MDNSGKIYSLLDQASFNQWLTEFFNKKSNELNYSRVNQPKRMEKLVLDLSVAQSEGYKVPVPFKSCVISRIYSTSTGIDKSGTVQILFDQPNIGNLKNAVSLFVNDTLKSETLFSEAYILWNAQADTSLEMFFFPDLEISTGTTKTAIVGTVTTTQSSVVPVNLVSFNYNTISTNTNFYTVPAGKYAIVRLVMHSTAGTMRFILNGNTVAETTSASPACQSYIVKTGTTLSCALLVGAGYISGSIEEYTVI